MHRLMGRLVLSPTDLTKHLGCAHITTLDLLAIEGKATPAAADEALELVFKLGLAHEDRYLQSLRDEGRSVVEIASGYGAERVQREAETLEAMQGGVDVVFQATFFDGSWGGQADFLLRVERPSALGPWSYDIADTKLSRKLKVPALLQMAAYAERLAILQGVEPDRLYVVTGDGQKRPWRLVDVAAFARRARVRLRSAVAVPVATEPVPVAHCGQCRWIQHCERHWRQTDDLSLVAFMRGDHRKALRESGIRTLTALGNAAVDDLPRHVSLSSRERLVQQARLQLEARSTKEPLRELLSPEPGKGLLRLPPPDDGDLYLDFEGDPYAEGGEGREYLAGIGDSTKGFTALWAHSRGEERQLTIDLVDLLLKRWREHAGMHVYHYAPYEQTALKRLTARYGVREAELDQLLRGERFVDLYAVVRQGMRIGKSSYSIKKMEHFYWGHIRSNNPDVADAMSSVIAYERWCETPDPQILDDILAYNTDDVFSTLALHEWLEGQRLELEIEHGPQPRPGEVVVDPGRPPGDAEIAENALAEELEHAGEELLAGVVRFHRREARPEYWEIFRLEDLTDEDLVDDSAAIGELSAPVEVGTVKRSTLYRYEFPPQDTKLKVGDTAQDVDDHKSAGTVEQLDAVAGFVVLKRKGDPKCSRGLSEKQTVADARIRAAIAGVAQDRLAGTDCLGSRLLDRVVATDLTALVPAALSLRGEVLAVQGPPGSGKTTRGAELVRALLDKGLRVGVTANSHAVIGHFLRSVDRPGVQKCDGEEFRPAPGMTRVDTIDEVVAALEKGAHLVGGTSWLWCDPRLTLAVDVLLVDEAGQFALANAVGCSRAGRSMILLGDPQQLPMPTRAQHPDSVGISVLAHMLGGHDTIPPERGFFLDSTWRMHPAITSYVSDLMYDGRLRSREGLERQAVDGQSGLRMVPVEHQGNAAASQEEVAAVVQLWKSLMGKSFTDSDGATRGMTALDVLIVAPYNNQVGLLRRALPAARVGTVDKFQGQEAPAVIYSMTSSSVEDAPRGVSFLYDLHRLNVAVSRAKALAFVVLSPRLLEASVSTPEQLRQVNALCRLAEVADTN